jgi:F-box/TPR repeat protein Pof3
VYEKLEKPREALKDAKKVIDIAPQQWHGYHRSAKLFHQLEKYPATIKMSEMALDRLQPGQANDIRRRALLDLKTTATLAQEKAERASANHIAKLPVELLTHIFLLAADYAESSVIVSTVCTHWRHIALSTPALWRTLVLAKSSKSIAKIRAWCARSKGRVTALVIRRRFGECLFTNLSYNPKGVQQIAEELSHLDWSSLKMVTLEGVQLPHFLRALDTIGQANLLERLVSFEWDGTVGDDFPVLNVHQGAPVHTFPDLRQLRTLILHNIRCLWPHLSPQSGNLVTLELHDHIRPNRVYHIRDLLVANSATLEVVVIRFLPTRETSSSPTAHETTSTSLPRLKHLELKNWSSPDEVFQGISIPAIQTMRLYSVLGGASLLELFNSDPTNQWADLRELDLRATIVPADNLISLLSRTHSLELLQFSGIMGITSQIAAALGKVHEHSMAPDSSIPPIPCPFLRHVNFSCSPQLSIGHLLQMAKVRAALADISNGIEKEAPWPVAKLESMVIDDCPALEVDYIPRLRAIVPAVSAVNHRPSHRTARIRVV